jgi:hypothetical protein
MELLELPKPSNIDGHSFCQSLFGDREKNPVHVFFAEASQPRIREEDEFQGLWPNNANAASVWYSDWKYTRVPWKNFEGVFQLSKDQLEQRNLIQLLQQKNPELLKKLRDELSMWQKNSAKVDTTFELSEEDKEKLESLGYVQ